MSTIRPDPQSGVSLVELLTGMTVAVLLVGSTLTGVVSHQSQRRVHSERILAMAACRNTMETLRSVDFATLPSFHGRGFDIPGTNRQTAGLVPVDGDADGMAGQIAVVEHSRNGSDVLYQVTTSVTWSGVTRGGRFEMQCLIGDRR